MSVDEYGNQYDDEGVLLLPPDLQELYESGGLNRDKAEALARAYRGSSPTQIPTSERVKDVTYVPPEPVGIPFVPRERPAGPSFRFGGEEYSTPLIAGYGRRLALIRPETGRGGATNDYGSAVSEDYLNEIEKTLNAVHRGEMTEEQLKERISQQEGIPTKPTDQQLSVFDKWQDFKKVVAEGIKIDPNAEYEKAKSERSRLYYSNMSVADQVLLTPMQKAKIESEADTYGTHARDKAQASINNELSNAKAFFEKQIALDAAKEKTPLVIQALREKLGREPTAQEKQDATQKAAVEIAGAKAASVEKGKSEGGFMSWTPEAKNQAFMYNVITKEPPVSTRGMASGDRKVYSKEYAQWQVDKDFKPQDIALMQADYKAGDISLKNMAKQEAPMSAFVGNINKQIAQVEKLYSKDDRLGLRLLDLPIRELRVRAAGSGDEAVKASYLLEIANEIGKLSSGSSASIQQLSDSAKEDWKKVHDVNLPLKEIMKVVNATRDQANMRMISWREAKEEVRNQIKSIGATGTNQPSGGGVTTTYYDNGKAYNIPADKEAAFLKARPNAKRGK